MKKHIKLDVTVKYRVGLGGMHVSQEVLEQIQLAADEGITLGIDTRDNEKFGKATKWLIDNIKEDDSYTWELEIDDFDTED